MQKDRLRKLQKLQELEFTCLDLNLYLDTHPMDQKALMDYNTYAFQLEKEKKEYEKIYGPLMNFGFSPSHYPWRWIEEPWPWEMEY